MFLISAQIFFIEFVLLCLFVSVCFPSKHFFMFTEFVYGHLPLILLVFLCKRLFAD